MRLASTNLKSRERKNMNGPAYRDRIYKIYSTHFQDLSPVFDEAASRAWGRAYRHYLRGWLPERRDAAIVDVACGGGRLLHFFRERGYDRIQGVDLSPSQIEIARQVIADVHEMNALDFLERNPTTFDLITGLDIIEHLHKPEVLRFLDAAYASLRPAGQLVLQTPNADSPWGTMLRYGDFTHEVCFNPNVLSRLMRLAGFREIESREVGPVPFGYGLKSTLRSGIWQGFRALLKVWNLVECGSAGDGIFTRVFLISGKR
jgi:2-polyprenyl-3-methyl-5-hydroxy-6-metoxy-1,4-benzoquinol methylase